MQAAQAAGQVVAQGIGAYADSERDEAAAAYDAAFQRGDSEGMAAAAADYNNWKEGGDSRAELHTAGGALIGGLGGGSIGSAGGGAAGAGISAGFARQLNSLADSVDNATGSNTLGNVTANALAGLAGAIVGGGAGAATASNADLYNRQLHPEERDQIADKANGDKAEEERLTRAGCYAVKCWAEYAPGSDQYNANYVSQLEASQLGPELAWVNNQKEAGLFAYTPGQKIADMFKSDPLGVGKDTAKIATGGLTVKTGASICAATGAGCALGGGGMIAFGLSDMAEGADGLYNRYNGISSSGTNPLRWGFNQLSPTWGATVYDGANLAFAIGALRAQVPLRMGTADGLNRSGSMFDVTVPRMNNNTLIPFIGQVTPYGTTQGILMFGVGTKGLNVIDDVRQAGGKK